MNEDATQPAGPERGAYRIRDFGRAVATTIAFFSIWFACIAAGFILPMKTMDHGDVASALFAYVFTGIAVVVGPIVAILVIRSIRNESQ